MQGAFIGPHRRQEVALRLLLLQLDARLLDRMLRRELGLECALALLLQLSFQPRDLVRHERLLVPKLAEDGELLTQSVDLRAALLLERLVLLLQAVPRGLERHCGAQRRDDLAQGADRSCP